MKFHTRFLAAIAFSLAVSATAAAQDDDGGQPVDGDTREQLEDTFGADPSDVRTHTGSEATTAAETTEAQAYATGNDVAFGPGEYDPGNTDGRRLLSHELSHTLQQQSVATTDPAEGGDDAEDTSEAETRIPERLRHRDRAVQDGDSGEARRRTRRDRPD